MLVAALDYQEMPILHSCIEMYAVIAQVLLQITYQHVTLFRLKPSAGMILQQVTFQTNQIATHSQVVRCQFHTYAGCFQRATPFVHNMLVISQYTAVGHLATGMESIGHRLQQSIASVTCKKIKAGSIGILQ